MTIAAELATRIHAMRYEDLPGEAIRWAKISLVDTLGCAFAGASEEAPVIARKVLMRAKEGGPGLPSWIWGTHLYALPMDAATINGTAAHALDYDDCNNSIAGHPSVPLLPAILALAEDIGASGRDVILAYVAGFETQGRIGRAVNTHHYQKGWHPTATLGVFGSAAACAKLLRLDAPRTAIALGIAASLAAGLKANFGTMVKPLHAGQCSRNGLYAALMAKEGFDASPEAFEHHHGFFEVFNGKGNYDAAQLFEHWGEPLEILAPGVGLKQYPCCASTHSAIDAMITLRQRHSLNLDQVERIETITHGSALAHTNRPDPRSALDAKFSVQYCVARALMHGGVTFDHFEEEALRDARVRELLKRITARTHPNPPRGMDEHYQGEVVVYTTGGQQYSARVDQPLRGPQNLTPPDRLEAKFKDCAAKALQPGAIARVYDLLQTFETVSDVRQAARVMADAVTVSTAERAAA